MSEQQPAGDQPATGQPGSTGPEGGAPPVRPEVRWPDRTGHATVDAAVRSVTEVAGAPPAEQLPAYQAAHRSLREALASIDDG
jgi:hypothetical protein